MSRTRDFIKVTNLKIYAYHGVFEEEKRIGQDFYINAKLYLDLHTPGKSDNLMQSLHYGDACHFIQKVFTEKKFDLIESACENLCQKLLLEYDKLMAVEVELQKPHAPIGLPFENVSVTMYREWHTVYLSFGSNIGDKKGYINEAIHMLKCSNAIRNVKESELFVTKPYGPVEQDDFLNGCLEMETVMDPEELVDYIHEIEDSFERDRSVRWGPRPIDLDIVFFDDCVYHSKRLTIPHADMENRMFVLEPLSQLCSGKRHPVWGKTVAQLKEELKKNELGK